MARKPSSRADQYCELHTHSVYSLLDGLPTPEQLLDRAAELGLPALALTDHDTVAGLPRFQAHAKTLGLKPILGTEVTLEDGSHLTLLAETDAGYSNLCQIVTAGRSNAGTGLGKLRWSDLQQHTNGLICLTGCRQGPVARAVIANDLKAAQHWLSYLIGLFGQPNLYVELQRHLNRDDIKLSRRLATLAVERHIPYVATSNVHYLARTDAQLQNALVSLRERVPLAKAGQVLRPNAEYFMRSPQNLVEIFADLPEAVANTRVIAERCSAQPPTGLELLPAFSIPKGFTEDDYLRELCLPRVSRYYPQQTDAARALLDQELSAIRQQGLANYFLIAADIAAFCERHNILYQAQGAWTNSLAAKLLGLSLQDPIDQPSNPDNNLQHDYLGTPEFEFEIDAARQAAVIQYLHERWGQEHVGLVARYLTFHSTSAICEAGFALGFSPETLQQISAILSTEGSVDELAQLDQAHLSGSPVAQAVERLQSPAIQLTATERQQLINLAEQLQGRPRALAEDSESWVITQDPVTQLMPTQPAAANGQTVVLFDRAGLERLGLPRFSLHPRAMLSALADSLLFIRDTQQRPVDLHRLDLNDPVVYDLIASARTVGVLQERSGQALCLIPHLQARCYPDLIVEASLLLRPGLLRNGIVQHYFRRRHGQEPVTYAQPFLESLLEETLGVLVFQEQAVQIAQALAGFTSHQADSLRQAFNQPNAPEVVKSFQAQFIEGALYQDVPFETAEQVWNMLLIFAGDSCSRASATVLATTIYWSARLRLYYPAEYFCALLRQARIGSYPASVLEAEAVRARVKFLPCDINRSKALPTLEANAIRKGLIHANGINDSTIEVVLLARGTKQFQSLIEVIERTRLDRRALEWLILTGACDSLGDRPHLLWELAEAFDVARRAQPTQSPNIPVELDELADEPALFMKFATNSPAARMHLTHLRRDAFTRAGCLIWQQLRKARVGAKVRVGGLVVAGVRRPPEAKGAALLRIDEPEGSIDVTIPEAVYLDCREALRSAFLIIEGIVESQGNNVSVVARKVRALA